jgi:RNA polymerase sigma-70 factor (ECF subfamily)
MKNRDVQQNWDELAQAAVDAGEYDSALVALVQGYQKIVLARCIFMIRDDVIAEEVAQEVFVAVWQGLKGFRGDSSFKTWILAIAYKRCKKHIGILGRLRRIAFYTRDKTIEEAQPDPSDSLEKAMISQQEAEQQDKRLRRALRKLSKKEREFIIMRYVDGKSLEEMAERYSVVRETVRQHLLQAERKLKRFYESIEL